uniref:non-specific serine/threonine protein kinase n=1 Tax=Opuntia streptacantha TaxID=393608 RepID=A0A7C8YLV3_OPUST
MLVGGYPFEDPKDPKNFTKTIGRILSASYSIPDYVRISQECKHLLSRIFVANPEKRITIEEIKQHPWFVKNLPRVQEESLRTKDTNDSSQSEEEILGIIEQATKPGMEGTLPLGVIDDQLVSSNNDLDDIELDADIDDVEISGDFVCAV